MYMKPFLTVEFIYTFDNRHFQIALEPSNIFNIFSNKPLMSRVSTYTSWWLEEGVYG